MCAVELADGAKDGRYPTLKGRPGRVQAVLIGTPAVIMIAIVLAAAWISS